MRKSHIPLVFIILAAVFLTSQDFSIDSLQKKTEEIGKLRFKQPVPVRYVTKSVMDAYITKVFADEYPDELAKNESDAALMFGFIRTPIDFKDLRRQILLENIGGLYNEATKEMQIPAEFRVIDQFSALTLIHEFRHAIQDQHFSLKKLLGGASDFHDRKLAALAAVEGDAYYCMLRFFDAAPVNAGDSQYLDSLSSFISFPGTSSLLNAPAILQRQLQMPYLEGVKFITHLQRRGEWGAVHAMLRNPPVSTEQILHPEKYLKGEMPAPVEIAYQPDPQVWKTSYQGVVGEYFLNILLHPEEAETLDKAKGWGGDTYQLFRNGQHLLLVWESSWDSEIDASRFFQDYRRFLESEYQFSFQYGEERGQIFHAGQGNGHYFYMRKSKNRMFYVRTTHRETMNNFINGGIYD